jgi:hypothetical protein
VLGHGTVVRSGNHHDCGLEWFERVRMNSMNLLHN